MKKELVDINFKKIIQYPKITGYSDNYPYKCTGFCIDCEKNKILKKNEKLVTISHGADSSDYKEKVNKKKYKNDKRIMFVFENPGGNINYDIGEDILYKGEKKYIPNCHYYWVEEIEKSIYDSYIFYLIEKFQLNNIYVTNLTKCKLRNNKTQKDIRDYSHIRNFCINNIFQKELMAFKPELIVCIGSYVYKHFPSNLIDESIWKNSFCLYHPAARMSKLNILQKNDKIMERCLKKLL